MNSNNIFASIVMKRILFLLSVCYIISCNQHEEKKGGDDLNAIATDYVRLGLNIGMYDSDFVDAYYGPDSLKPLSKKLDSFPKAGFLQQTEALQARLKPFIANNDSLTNRAKWISKQLLAFSRRIKIFSGERSSFDEESAELFGVVAPSYPESYFKDLVAKLDSSLPGKEPISERFQLIAKYFIIPKGKIDTVFKTAIEASRKRTAAHYDLPANEHFTLEYVTGKPWSGYNWYKGNYTSNIQINTDLDIFIERAIDVASHESYPGHHVYNMLLEKNVYHDKNWQEIALYPLFSPQSLIAEGSANYGIDVAFPGNEKIDFARNVLLPVAGVDTTGISLYFKLLELKGKLNFVRNEVARGLVNNKMTEDEALRWLMEYGLSNRETAIKSISFIKKYGSYVINYNYGLELVKNYIESAGGVATSPDKRWALFGALLSNEVTTDELLKK
jgi:predicted transcriptional regulator